MMKCMTIFLRYGSGFLLACLLSACDKPAAPDTRQVQPISASSPDISITPVSTAQVPTTDAEKFSYMLGVQLASSVPGEVVALDKAFVLQGIEDVLNGKTLKMRDMELQKMLHQYGLMLKAHQEQQRATLEKQHGIRYQQIEQSGKLFLEQNRQQPGVTETADGVQYTVLTPGQGKHPTAQDRVRVHYSASFVEQEQLVEFDSSYKRQTPVVYALKDVIPGWQVILPLMQEGARYRVVVPASKAYGRPGIMGGEIPESATLVYEMELLEVLSNEQPAQ
jgi:FKBP-type peptidyl-prolyl cis-trans isomerase FklB